MPESAIYTGHVMHARRGVPAHAFRYPLYMLLLDLDELPALDRRLKLFGHNTRRPISFRDDDHLEGAGAVRERLRDLVEAAGAAWPGGGVRLLTHARVFGYVFNPVSFFFCHANSGELTLVVAEVNNTFGERHAYVLDDAHAVDAAGAGNPVPDDALLRGPSRTAGQARCWRTKKVFHVSPFKSLDGTYVFTIAPPSDSLDIRIALTVGAETRFAARLALERRPLSDRELARALVRYPLMTAQVIGAIHWEALRLWRKGAHYRRKPRYDPALGARETMS